MSVQFDPEEPELKNQETPQNLKNDHPDEKWTLFKSLLNKNSPQKDLVKNPESENLDQNFYETSSKYNQAEK